MNETTKTSFNVSQLFEIKEDLFWVSWVQSVLFSFYERWQEKTHITFTGCVSFASLCFSLLSLACAKEQFFFFVKRSSLAINTISISNVLSMLRRIWDKFFFWLGEKHSSSCKISTLISVSPYNFSLREKNRKLCPLRKLNWGEKNPGGVNETHPWNMV